MSSTSIREVIEGLQQQGTTEQIIYTLDTTPYGGSPSAPAVVAYDERDWSSVTATILSGSASVASNVISTPTVQSGRVGSTYRIVVTWTVSGGTRSAFFRVRFEL